MLHKQRVQSSRIRAIVLLLGVGFAASAHSEANMAIHVDGGYSKLKLDRAVFDAATAPYANGAPVSTVHPYNGAYRLGLSYRLHKRFALESQYIQLGESKYRAPLVSGGEAKGSVVTQGLGLSAVGRLPVKKDLVLYGRAGGMYAHSEAKLVLDEAGTREATGNKLGSQLGLGVEYEYAPMYSLRAELERIRNIGKADITGTLNTTNFWLGLSGRF